MVSVRRIAWSTVALLAAMFLAATSLSVAHASPSEEGMTWEEADNECSWIAAADNVPCFVVPVGDYWKASEATVLEDGSWLTDEGLSGCIDGWACDPEYQPPVEAPEPELEPEPVETSEPEIEEASPAEPVEACATFTG